MTPLVPPIKTKPLDEEAFYALGVRRPVLRRLVHVLRALARRKRSTHSAHKKHADGPGGPIYSAWMARLGRLRCAHLIAPGSFHAHQQPYCRTRGHHC